MEARCIYSWIMDAIEDIDKAYDNSIDIYSTEEFISNLSDERKEKLDEWNNQWYHWISELMAVCAKAASEAKDEGNKEMLSMLVSYLNNKSEHFRKMARLKDSMGHTLGFIYGEGYHGQYTLQRSSSET